MHRKAIKETLATELLVSDDLNHDAHELLSHIALEEHARNLIIRVPHVRHDFAHQLANRRVQRHPKDTEQAETARAGAMTPQRCERNRSWGKYDVLHQQRRLRPHAYLAPLLTDESVNSGAERMGATTMCLDMCVMTENRRNDVS